MGKSPEKTKKRGRKASVESEENEPEEILKSKADWLSDDSGDDEDTETYFGDKKIVSYEEGVDGEEQDMDDRKKDAMETFNLPDNEEEAENNNPELLQKRIDEVLSILHNFRDYQNTQSEKGVKASEITSRSSFIEQLKKDCAMYYGYLPSLIDLFFDLFSPHETVEFLESNERTRPTVIRVNTLRTRRKQLAEALIKRGVNLKPLDNFGDVGITILDSTVPIGATPEYLAGHYMLQAPSSFCPVIALDPQPNERILDMASAPGGKTSYIAQLMNNTGVIVANEKSAKRIQATIANLSRLGCTNAIHVNLDGRDFPRIMAGFDRVLLDAPCSGLGVVCRDPTVKLQRDEKDIQRNAALQKQLLLSAIDSAKVGGIIVYSTCSLAVEENERVVQYALDNRGIIIEDTTLTVGKNGLVKFQKTQFHPTMKKCKRFFPHVHNTDGFFVARLKKISRTQTTQVQVAFSRRMTKKHKRRRQEKEEKLAQVSETSG